jgi:hypothetical protein
MLEVSSNGGVSEKSTTPAEYTSTSSDLFFASSAKIACAITLRHRLAVQISATEGIKVWVAQQAPYVVRYQNRKQ